MNIDQETLMMLVAYVEESVLDPQAREVKNLIHHCVNNNKIPNRVVSTSLTPKMSQIKVMVASEDFLTFQKTVNLNSKRRAIVFWNFLMPFLQEGFYLRKDIYLKDEEEENSKRGKIGLNTPEGDNLIMPFAACTLALANTGIQSSRIHGEYVCWKNLFIVSVPKKLCTEKIRNFNNFIEGYRSRKCKLGTVPKIHGCVWENYNSMTHEQRKQDPYYKRFCTWNAFEKREADNDHSVVVDILRSAFGCVFPIGHDHNYGNLFKSIVDTAKVRSYKQAKCKNFSEVVAFYDAILSSCPEFLHLPERLISSSDGLLNGIPIVTHPDFSHIYQPMMQELKELYNV